MNPLVRDRRIEVPPGYAERECFVVTYRMPFCAHCFVLCHEPANAGHPDVDPAVMAFFIAEAHRLSLAITGNTQSFVTIFSGSTVRKRENLHMHVFVIRRRFQKAWLYTLLATIHSVSALRRGLLRLLGRQPRRPVRAGRLGDGA